MASRANLESKISLNNSEFNAKAQGVVATAGKMGKGIATGAAAGIKSIGGITVAAAKAAAAVGAIATAGLGAGLKKAFDVGGQLSDFSAQTGATVEDLAILALAFENNGISAENTRLSINKLQRGIVEAKDGIGTAKIAFEALAISADELSKLGAADQFKLLGKEIASIEDPAERAARSMQIFGRSGAELITLFKDKDAVGIAAASLGKQAQILDENAQTFDRIADILGAAGKKLQGFFVGIGSVVAGPVLAVLEKFDKIDLAELGIKAGQALQGFFATLGGLVQGAVNGARQVQAAFAQGKVGEILLNAVKLAGGELVNNFLGAINFLRDGLISAVTFTASLFRQLYIEGGILPIVTKFNKAMIAALGGTADIVRGVVGGAFNDIVSGFQAGLEFAIQKAMEGLSNIPVLNDFLGLSDFQSQTFAEIKAEHDAQNESAELIATGKEKLAKAVSLTNDAIVDYGNIVSEALQDAEPLAFEPEKLVDTDKFRDAISDSISSIEFEEFSIDSLFEGSIKAAAEKTKEGGDFLLNAMKSVGEKIEGLSLQEAIDSTKKEGKIQTFGKDDSLIRRFNRMSDTDKAKSGGLGSFLRSNGFNAKNSLIAQNLKGGGIKALKAKDKQDPEARKLADSSKSAEEHLAEINGRLEGLKLLTV